MQRDGSANVSDDRCIAAEVPAIVVFADVVFAEERQMSFLSLLRPGFRHCFVAVRQEQAWMILDPLANQTHLAVVSGIDAGELAEFYRSRSLHVVETCVRSAPQRLALLPLYTCVEAVKRVLGIHAPFVLTPWQLYRWLTRPSAPTIDSAAPLDKGLQQGL